MSDPWLDEWNTLSYTERLNWWWSARAAYQSQEDYAAGKSAAEGVSCKYGIPGFWPGTRTPYVKTDAPATTDLPTADAPATTETPIVATPENVYTEAQETTENTTEETSDSNNNNNPGTVNLIIPPSNSSLNVSKSAKKRKNKNKH